MIWGGWTSAGKPCWKNPMVGLNRLGGNVTQGTAVLEKDRIVQAMLIAAEAVPTADLEGLANSIIFQ